ncbi:MAG: nucleoside deaminase, partial [Candidatus Omnitrophica bacterium]|nr:nucleoside deaminase [Candidatus Omnitrophota bacterium]
RVFYGTTIADAKRIGFNELSVSASRLKQLGKSRVRVTANFLRKECRRLFDAWEQLENKRLY